MRYASIVAVSPSMAKYLFVEGLILSANSVEVYDPETNLWCYLKNMNECRCGLGLVAVNGQLLAIRGHDGTVLLNTVEKYCPETDTWSFCKSMKSSRANHGVGVLPKL